ncbi:hypothetical protein J4032_10810 [Streptomyces formicae]|uniref:Copper amine oxidase catalytic domain-containing protein n=1 Tax=Streptomyces formicae TaxID=1616117 RepID=A0ABY3WQ75_9ACTN|nr:hypothetical protein J4032_10810 [Streptomyces formicae]
MSSVRTCERGSPGPTAKHPGRATVDCGRGAPDSVDKWVNGEMPADPVVWVNTRFHHIARDEDQQSMPVHRQGFQLVPRDVTAMNPLTPADLVNRNGAPPSGS